MPKVLSESNGTRVRVVRDGSKKLSFFQECDSLVLVVGFVEDNAPDEY